MIHQLLHSYSSSRGQILGWGAALLGLGLLVVPAYDLVSANQAQFEALIQNYPQEVAAFFGDLSQFATPAGFLHLEFFSYMPLVLGIYALLVGSSLIAGDEESGRLDLIAAQPLSRASLFLARVLAMTATTASILILGWAGFLIGMSWSTLSIGPVELLPPFISLFAVTLPFAALALLLSELLPSRRLAATLTGLYLLLGYVLTSMARLNADLEPFARLSPLRYYQGGEALEGVTWGWIAGLFALSIILTVAAYVVFERRDLRVGGEGTLRLPWPLPRNGRAEPSS